jgi:CubicO group peptidase (beta-lactamase class C family)
MKTKLLLLFILIVEFSSSSAQSISAKMDSLLTAYNNQYKFNGVVLVVKGGNVLLKKGYGYKDYANKKVIDPNGIFQIGSITKQFTSTVILRLYEQGKLDVKDKLIKYIPDFPRGNEITLENLLTHTSGIYNYTNDNKFMNIESLLHVELERMISMMKSKPLEFQPGTKFSYSNSNYILLGYIIQKVTGKPYEQVVHEYIFNPLGMTHSGFDFKNLKDTNKVVGYLAFDKSLQVIAPIVDSSASFAAGAMYSTLDDLYKWDRGLYGNKVVSQSSLEKAYTPKLNKYGYGWFIDSIKGKRILTHNGGIFGFTADFVRIPADDVCIIVLCNEGENLTPITKGLKNILYDLPYELPAERKSIQLPEEELKEYVGEYWVSETIKVNITLEAGQLKVQLTGQPKVELFAQRKDLFFIKVVDAQLEFKRDSAGKLQKVVIYQGGAMVEAPKVK